MCGEMPLPLLLPLSPLRDGGRVWLPLHPPASQSPSVANDKV